MKTNLGETFFPPTSFLHGEAENGNFQTAVKIVWQVVLTDPKFCF